MSDKDASVIEYIPDLSILKVNKMWTAQFIGRKLKESNRIQFDGRMELPSDKYYRYLDIKTDDNNVIKWIDAGKIVDNSYSFGKPRTASLKFGAADIKDAVIALSEVAEPRVTYEMLEALVNNYSADHPECNLNMYDTKLSLSSKEFKSSVPISKIIEYWEISYSYLDIIYNPDFWAANDYLNLRHRNLVLKLLSEVNVSEYPDYEQLKSKEERNKYLTEAIPKYQMLCEAVSENDTVIIDALIDFSNLDYFKNELNVFEMAIDKNDMQLVRKLIKAKAYVSDDGLTKAADVLSDDWLFMIIEQQNLSENHTLTEELNRLHKYDLLTAAVNNGAMCSDTWLTHNEYTHDCEALIFVFGAGGSLGKVHYVNGKFITSDLCYILTAKNCEETNLKYYYAYFNSRRKEIVQRLARGTNKKAINDTRLRNYQILYPSKCEQDRVGQIVDKSFMRIENLKRQIVEETESISTLL